MELPLRGFVTECKGHPTVVLEGEADRGTTTLIRDLFASALARDKHLFLDLKDLSFTDGGMVGVILDLLSTMPPDGVLHILNARTNVRRILQLGGIAEDRHVQIE